MLRGAHAARVTGHGISAVAGKDSEAFTHEGRA
ncbi:hypothetical protein CBM2586_B90090 [Cupriavidus phytorum]|uniref:Uncharacterized protein n=1 Tax=Cupriavidus taiwanensis TaxID=164546 RepID=A0A375CNM5_9BURK|nr:hypothetical protein CBM2586_B90090 [Cupriavidus taiwanensis]